MAIEDRNLKGGEKLVAAYKGKAHTCAVSMTADGLRFVVDGKPPAHTSPSAAGSAVRDGKATNGWAFWSLAGTEKVRRTPRPKGEARGSARATRAKVAAAQKAKAPASITEHREKKARVGKAAVCGICGEKRKTAQALASHLRAHDRADAKAAKAAAQPAQAEASV